MCACMRMYASDGVCLYADGASDGVCLYADGASDGVCLYADVCQ